MASFTSPIFFSIMLWITVTVITVSAAPISLSDQQDISDFSNSNKEEKQEQNVFLPFRELPERLIDNFTSEELDDDAHDLPPESDINYFFKHTRIQSVAVIDDRKRGEF
uniref:Uncharacterized protein n=1 Tax=Caenorhabditis tropicalis TaxID=1561998 RepID=A0A1I7UVK6_9PELO